MNNICQECGMVCKAPTEYHPYAACLMFKACHDGDTVRANLQAVRNDGAPGAPQEADVLTAALQQVAEYARMIEELRAMVDAAEAAQEAAAVPAPTVEQAIDALVTALRDSKGWMRDYADALIRDAIDRTAAVPAVGQELLAELSAEVQRQSSTHAHLQEWDEVFSLIGRLAVVVSGRAGGDGGEG